MRFDDVVMQCDIYLKPLFKTPDVLVICYVLSVSKPAVSALHSSVCFHK